MTDSKIFTSTKDEENLDHALQLVTDAIPESQVDAMKNYAKALRFLYAIKDPRIQPYTILLEDLYVYPERKSHNDVMTSLSEFRETLLEEKLDKRLASNLEGETANLAKPKQMITWKFIIALAIVIMMLRIIKGA